jgi:hypothetical protein
MQKVVKQVLLVEMPCLLQDLRTVVLVVALVETIDRVQMVHLELSF